MLLLNHNLVTSLQNEKDPLTFKFCFASSQKVRELLKAPQKGFPPNGNTGGSFSGIDGPKEKVNKFLGL